MYTSTLLSKTQKYKYIFTLSGFIIFGIFFIIYLASAILNVDHSKNNQDNTVYAHSFNATWTYGDRNCRYQTGGEKCALSEFQGCNPGPDTICVCSNNIIVNQEQGLTYGNFALRPVSEYTECGIDTNICNNPNVPGETLPDGSRIVRGIAAVCHNPYAIKCPPRQTPGPKRASVNLEVICVDGNDRTGNFTITASVVRSSDGRGLAAQTYNNVRPSSSVQRYTISFDYFADTDLPVRLNLDNSPTSNNGVYVSNNTCAGLQLRDGGTCRLEYSGCRIPTTPPPASTSIKVGARCMTEDGRNEIFKITGIRYQASMNGQTQNGTTSNSLNSHTFNSTGNVNVTLSSNLDEIKRLPQLQRFTQLRQISPSTITISNGGEAIFDFTNCYIPITGQCTSLRIEYTDTNDQQKNINVASVNSVNIADGLPKPGTQLRLISTGGDANTLFRTFWMKPINADPSQGCNFYLIRNGTVNTNINTSGNTTTATFTLPNNYLTELSRGDAGQDKVGQCNNKLDFRQGIMFGVNYHADWVEGMRFCRNVSGRTDGGDTIEVYCVNRDNSGNCTGVQWRPLNQRCDNICVANARPAQTETPRCTGLEITNLRNNNTCNASNPAACNVNRGDRLRVNIRYSGNPSEYIYEQAVTFYGTRVPLSASNTSNSPSFDLTVNNDNDLRTFRIRGDVRPGSNNQNNLCVVEFNFAQITNQSVNVEAVCRDNNQTIRLGGINYRITAQDNSTQTGTTDGNSVRTHNFLSNQIPVRVEITDEIQRIRQTTNYPNLEFVDPPGRTISNLTNGQTATFVFRNCTRQTQNPNITIEKRLIEGNYQNIRNNVVFDIVVRNTGNVDIRSFNLSDEFDSRYLEFVDATYRNVNLAPTTRIGPNNNLITLRWDDMPPKSGNIPGEDGILTVNETFVLRVRFRTLQSTDNLPQNARENDNCGLINTIRFVNDRNETEVRTVDLRSCDEFFTRTPRPLTVQISKNTVTPEVNITQEARFRITITNNDPERRTYNDIDFVDTYDIRFLRPIRARITAPNGRAAEITNVPHVSPWRIENIQDLQSVTNAGPLGNLEYNRSYTIELVYEALAGTNSTCDTVYTDVRSNDNNGARSNNAEACVKIIVPPSKDTGADGFIQLILPGLVSTTAYILMRFVRKEEYLA